VDYALRRVHIWFEELAKLGLLLDDLAYDHVVPGRHVWIAQLSHGVKVQSLAAPHNFFEICEILWLLVISCLPVGLASVCVKS
jgi:hypothetical protein